MQSPIFSSQLPLYFNYARLGTIIGHEINHAFDNEGSMYGPHGTRNDWFSKESRQKYQEKAKCFSDQYSQFTEPKTNMKLNGIKTLGDDIADNGGLQQAFNAYSKISSNDKLLPGLENYTRQQLFFLSYANLQCMNAGTEYMRLTVALDTHSPSRFRINVPLMNSPDFTSAFSCPKGSKMNPENKCSFAF